MKLAVSNIALTAFDHAAELRRVADLGVEGIEVAPSRVWRDTWNGLTAADVTAYRNQLESGGLHAVGLHSLLYDQPDMSLCHDKEQRQRLLDFFVHLSAVCRDLGGSTLVWGGGRRRDGMPMEDAVIILVEFFGELSHRTQDHGTSFCIEPLGRGDTDFLNSVLEIHDIVRTVNSPSLKIQIDARALTVNEEFDLETFSAVKDGLVHYHANEPGFEVLGSSGTVDHVAGGIYLKEVGYQGYVSLEQKLMDPADPLAAIAQSVSVMNEAYR